MSPTLEFLNHVLPFQKSAAVKKQAEILGVGATPTEIANKILDTHRQDVLVCISGGNEASLDGPPTTLVTVMPLLDPTRWRINLTFPLSGPRDRVLKTLQNLRVAKR